MMSASRFIDRLEPRQLLAVTFEQLRNTLIIRTDDVGASVQVALRNDENYLVVKVDGVEAERFRKRRADPGDTRRKVRRIRFEGGAGNDSFQTASAIDDPATVDVDETDPIDLPVTLLGGDGNDYLSGDRRKDLLIGGRGDDRLLGLSRRDTLFGGTGNDTLDGGNGSDILFGQDGDDYLRGGESRDALYGLRGADLFNAGQGERDIIRLDDDGDQVESPIGDSIIRRGDAESYIEYSERFIDLTLPHRYKRAARQ